MKKFTLFVAAIFVAMGMSAETEYKFSTLENESDWTVSGATKNTSASTKSKMVYNITADVLAQIVPQSLSGNIEFQIKNTKDKEKAFAIGLGNYFEFGGKNGVLVLKNVKKGSTIKLLVASKGSASANFLDTSSEPKFPVGAEAITENLLLPVKDTTDVNADKEGYVWVTLEYEAFSNEVKIKEFDGGYRIKSITATFEEGTSLDDVDAVSAKAKKVMMDGQLYIIKNGIRYNALGVQAD